MWRFRRARRRRSLRTNKERAHYLLHKEAARRLVHARIAYWQPFLQVTPGRIAIKDQRSRWGSCSTKGNLNFNYRLAFLPVELADYVVVHELCHLIEFNHSPEFWRHVALRLPDYALRKQALYEYTKLLASVPSELTPVATYVS